MRRKNSILALLQGGDRRSIGRSDQVAAIVSGNPKLFSVLVGGLWSQDPLVRMRTADAAEKVTRENPQLLKPYKKELLGLMGETSEAEVRWHLAVMVPRLVLNPGERRLAARLLGNYLKDRGSIVKTFALEGLAELARNDSELRSGVIEILRQAVRTGSPAMKARSRKLLSRLEKA